MRRRIAVPVALLLACAAIIVLALAYRTARPSEAARASEVQPAPDTPDATTVASLAGPSATDARTSVPIEARAAIEERAPDEGGGDASDPAAALEALLDELRERAGHAEFHVSAWPAVRGIAALLAEQEPREPALAARVREVALDEAEHPRVRSACAVAAALAADDVATEIADALARAQPAEVQRGAWLARGLTSAGEEGLVIELERFKGRLPAFPVVVTRTAVGSMTSDALERVDRPIPLAAEGFAPEETDVRREEFFVRQVAVLAILGPSMRWPGSIRDRALRWLEEKSLEAAAVRPAALHCLALAARDDEGLARQLVALARAHLFEVGGAEILKALATLSDRDELVVPVLADFFREVSTIEEPWRTLANAEALQALEGILNSSDAEARGQAIGLAMERVLDPQTDEFERTLFLAMLAGTEAGSGVLFDILSLASATGDPNTLATELSLIGSAPPDQHPAAHAFLVQLLGNPGATAELRRSIYVQIAAIAAPGALDVIRGQLASEADPELRELLERLVTKLGG